MISMMTWLELDMELPIESLQQCNCTQLSPGQCKLAALMLKMTSQPKAQHMINLLFIGIGR